MYQPMNFDHLIGTQGFSDILLKNHFTLYQGYVTNTNKFLEKFQTARTDGTVAEPTVAELRRRFGWEFNGMRLHELYFGNMAKGGVPYDAGEPVGTKIEKDFGSFDAWAKEFKAVGAQRGIGWAVLAYDKQADQMINLWVNEHDVGHLATCTPLLILDIFEHAYVTDYGIKRADYIEAFMNAVDWKVVGHRLGN